MQLTMPKGGMQFYCIFGTFATNPFTEHHFSTFNLLCVICGENFSIMIWLLRDGARLKDEFEFPER